MRGIFNDSLAIFVSDILFKKKKKKIEIPRKCYKCEAQPS